MEVPENHWIDPIFLFFVFVEKRQLLLTVIVKHPVVKFVLFRSMINEVWLVKVGLNISFSDLISASSSPMTRE